MPFNVFTPMIGQLSDLDLRLIRVFLTVVQAGGISQAQTLLNVGQPTISTQLATLETRLGFRLCQRGRSGFQLTDKGRWFVEMSRELLRTVENFERQARNIGKQLVGTLDIGLIGHTPIAQNIRLSQAIRRFRERNEAVRFNIGIHAPRDLEERLLNGGIQIAIGYFWHRAPALDYTPLFIERQIAYCGHTHPLFPDAGQVTASDVSDHDWAWRSYALPASMPATPPHRTTAIADNMEAIALLIMSGHLGYLPQHFAEPYVSLGLMAPLNPSLFQYDVTFHLVCRKPRRLDEITKAFLADLRTTYLDTP